VEGWKDGSPCIGEHRSASQTSYRFISALILTLVAWHLPQECALYTPHTTIFLSPTTSATPFFTLDLTRQFFCRHRMQKHFIRALFFFYPQIAHGDFRRQCPSDPFAPHPKSLLELLLKSLLFNLFIYTPSYPPVTSILVPIVQSGCEFIHLFLIVYYIGYIHKGDIEISVVRKHITRPKTKTQSITKYKFKKINTILGSQLLG
jgi:hypothetical protein